VALTGHETRDAVMHNNLGAAMEDKKHVMVNSFFPITQSYFRDFCVAAMNAVTILVIAGCVCIGLILVAVSDTYLVGYPHN
jgi:hypothetical protein